jgi:polyhydroxyalkanoate synthesis regulator phasin
MDPMQIARQMISINKTVFNNNFNQMKVLYEQTERLINKFWEKLPMCPEEGRKAISEGIKACKKGSEDFKNIVDENFKKAEDYFNAPK